MYHSNFALKPEDFAELTDGQIVELYFAKRDDKGKLVREGEEEGVTDTYRGHFFWVWRKRGLSDKEIEARWKEMTNAGRRHRREYPSQRHRRQTGGSDGRSANGSD
jgi:hypothetical protein